MGEPTPTAQDMCSLVADMANPGASVREVLLGAAEVEERKPHRMKVYRIGDKEQGKPVSTIKSFDELRKDSSLFKEIQN